MFLHRLSEPEKKSFLQLVHHIARSDGKFAKREQEVIDQFCAEMRIDNIDYKESDFDLQATLNQFKSDEAKKIVLLEAMGLVYCDDVLATQEEAVLKKITKAYNISDTYAVFARSWAKSALQMFEQGKILLVAQLEK